MREALYPSPSSPWLMRPARMLHSFIPSFFHSYSSASISLKYKSQYTCLGCRRIQYPFITNRLYSTEPNLPKKKIFRPIEPSISICKLSQQGRSDEALSAYLKLVDQGVFPSNEALHQLARSLYVTNNLAGMRTFYDTLMNFYKVHEPTNKSRRSLSYIYVMFINMVARTTKSMQTIEQLCQDMSCYVKRGNIALYNTLLKVFLNNNDVRKADRLYRQIKRHSTPTAMTYGILMNYASKRRDLRSMIKYLDDMAAYSIPVDYAIIEITVSTLCRVKAFDLAEEMVKELHRGCEKLVPPRFQQHLLCKIDVRKKRHYRRKQRRVNKKKGLK